MVTQTRRKRKQISYYEADSDEDDLAMEEMELEMDEVQATRFSDYDDGQSPKKAKPPTKAPFEMIPDELLPHILSYMEDIREIYHLSKMKKSIRNAISPELVIRAAVFSGRQYSSILSALMCEISNRRIRVPSTLRLLRLLNAKCCERGTECFCYNLQTERSGPLKWENYRPFGMAICDPCLRAHSTSWGTDCPSVLRSTKVCTHGWSTVLCHPQVEQVTKEAVGPIILFRDIKQIQYSYSDNAKREEVLESTVESAKAQAIGPEDEARLERFCDTYEKAKIEYTEYLENKRRIQEEQREQKHAKRAAQKKKLTGAVIQKLEPHLAGFQYASLILNRDWNQDKAAYNFHHWPSTIAFDRLMEAPSCATQKTISRAATRVKNLYTSLEELGFLGGTFPNRLNQWLNLHPNMEIHKKALLRYFTQHKTSMAILPRKEGYYCHIPNRMYEATLEGDRAKMILQVLSPEDCRNAFACEVVRAANGRGSHQKRLQLAKHLWTIRNAPRWGNNRHLIGFSRLHDFGQKFDTTQTEFMDVLRKIRRYKKHPDTKAWIDDTLESGNFSASLTPRDAIDTLYEGDFGRSGIHASFTEWRRHHATLVRTAFASARA